MQRSPGAEQTITESALIACESSVVYRRRNLGKVTVATVAELVLFDGENPRSLVYQLERIRLDLRAPPGATGSSRPQRLVDEVSARLRRLDPTDLETVDTDGFRTELASLLDGWNERCANCPKPSPTLSFRCLVNAAAGRAGIVTDTAFPDGPTPSPGSRCYRVTHRTEYRYSDIVTSSYGRGHLTPGTPCGRGVSDTNSVSNPIRPTGRPAETSTATSARISTCRTSSSVDGGEQLRCRGRSARPRRVRRGCRTGAVGGRAAGGPRGGVGNRIHAGPIASRDNRRGKGNTPLPALNATGRLSTSFATSTPGSFATSPTGPGRRRCRPRSTMCLGGEGVCQDFARLAIACLRVNGLAASYVSATSRPTRLPAKNICSAMTPLTPGRRCGRRKTSGWEWIRRTTSWWTNAMSSSVGDATTRTSHLRGIIFTDAEHSVIDVSVGCFAVLRWGCACVISYARIVVSIWRSRILCVWRVAVPSASRCGIPRCW